MKPNILVFDCEATSLYGNTFAVGAIVMDRNTRQILAQYELLAEEGIPLVDDWVKKNVLPHLNGMPTCKSLKELREGFFHFYLPYKETCDVFSDVVFPVETNFLSAIVADDIKNRQWQMPYPLYDIVNYVAIEIERIAASGLPGLRKHHPLDDVLASAICYLNAIPVK